MEVWNDMNDDNSFIFGWTVLLEEYFTQKILFCHHVHAKVILNPSDFIVWNTQEMVHPTFSM